MENIWNELYNKAKAVLNKRGISEKISAGGVAAAVESDTGKIYTGVCVDTACTLGICAERNAIFSMITNGDSGIRRVLAIRSGGEAVSPCGACRELMVQLMPESYQSIEIMMDYHDSKIKTLGDLTPDWWL